MESTEVIISIVIPCFNDGSFLLEAVQSAEATQGVHHEIIIVNDGSSDSVTLEVLTLLEKRGHRILHQENKGLGAARNWGISLAQGRYILPLDSDNRIRSNYPERAVAILERDHLIDVVYGDAEFFGEKTGRNHVPDFNLGRLLSWNFIDACAVFRKQTWELCGGYDESLPYLEDWDFWCRIACNGGGFYHVAEVLYDYRVRKNSMSSGMSDPVRMTKVLQHMRSKKITIPMGDYLEAHQSWRFVADGLRHRPIRTLVKLALKAYFPARHSQIKHS